MRFFIMVAMPCLAGLTHAQPANAPAMSESEVTAEPVPPQAVASAVAAVAKLGDEVVLGRYQAAVDRMYPRWKDRYARRIGGMAELEKRLEATAAEMVKQGVSMISFKPQGKPEPYEVLPGRKVVRVNGQDVERLVHTKWMVLVPTVTKFRITRSGDPKPLVIESIGYQVAVCDKGKNDWTFIDGAGLTVSDLRSLFPTLPKDMKLPDVRKREVQ